MRPASADAEKQRTSNIRIEKYQPGSPLARLNIIAEMSSFDIGRDNRRKVASTATRQLSNTRRGTAPTAAPSLKSLTILVSRHASARLHISIAANHEKEINIVAGSS